MEWYYAKDGQQRGPVERAVLEQMLASRQIAPSDLVWNEGMTNWQPAGTCPEICGLIASPQGVAPAPLPSPVAAPLQQSPPMPSFQVQPLEYGGGNPLMAKSYQGLAIGGFVTSLFGIPCLYYCIGWIAAPTGLILSWVALNGMSKSGNQAGKGLAIAGVIIGGIYSLIMLIMAIILAIASVHK